MFACFFLWFFFSWMYNAHCACPKYWSLAGLTGKQILLPTLWPESLNALFWSELCWIDVNWTEVALRVCVNAFYAEVLMIWSPRLISKTFKVVCQYYVVLNFPSSPQICLSEFRNNSQYKYQIHLNMLYNTFFEANCRGVITWIVLIIDTIFILY